jgi:hypothetical protein
MLHLASTTQLALRLAIRSRLPLLLILLLAFSLRLLTARFLTGPIDSEGAEYARIAENLLSGNGYVGIATPGKELMFPPLFPLLIAAVSLLTHQSEAGLRAGAQGIRRARRRQYSVDLNKFPFLRADPHLCERAL